MKYRMHYERLSRFRDFEERLDFVVFDAESDEDAIEKVNNKMKELNPFGENPNLSNYYHFSRLVRIEVEEESTLISLEKVPYTETRNEIRYGQVRKPANKDEGAYI